MKLCPYCAEEIQDAAIVCKHCGRDLVAPTPAAAVQAPVTTSRTGRRWLITLGVLGVLFGLFYFLWWGTSVASVDLGAARRAIEGLERDGVLTERHCRPNTGQFNPSAWASLSDTQQRTVMQVLARVCMEDAGLHNTTEVDLINFRTKQPLAHFDGRLVTSR